MRESLRAFMEGIIDYAGLFPPSELPLDPAIHNYARYREGEDSWMLSRFIIPASRLLELKAYHEELFVKGEPFEFSVLGSKTDTAEEFRGEVESIVRHCAEFHQQHRGRVTTDILEIKLPEEAVQANDEQMLEGLLSYTARSFSTSLRLPGQIFYETALSESWENDLETVLRAVANHNEPGEEFSASSSYAGIKLRCGGVEASMFPTPEQVAFALNRAREYGLAMKCTAGLHHPVRHYDATVQTKMHGFFNVFGGAMLAHIHDLTDEELVEIIREEDPEQFVFDDEDFAWNGLSISTGEIRKLRNTALISYGSCSFDEPREDLKNLGLF